MIIILADDLGFSDIGAFGGEIPTPNLDRLAAEGMRFSNFHVSASCSPTRAMLMSGQPAHIAGVGTVPEIASERQKQSQGYSGRLNLSSKTIAERLGQLEYQTFFTGKWHLGETPDADPHERGFDRTFALLTGAASHFGDQLGSSGRVPIAPYTVDGEPISIPDNFFSSDFYTDKAIEMIEKREPERPFFSYLAFTAPHFPLQAPQEWKDKFSGKYDDGYLPVASARFEAAKAEGVIPANAQVDLAGRISGDWSAMTPEDRERSARRMELYAAMVANLDWNVGRLLAFLEQEGLEENTIIVFLSDNGPDFSISENAPFRAEWVAQNFDNSFENWGNEGSFISYGRHWAEVGATPFYLFKGTMAEGGVRSPTIIKWPGRVGAGEISNSFLTAMDIAPTLVDIAGGNYETSPYGGVSFQRHMEDNSIHVHAQDYMVGGESLSTMALFRGEWKLLLIPEPLGDGRWNLFNLSTDPLETEDLSDTHSEIKDEMLAAWETYSEETGIVPSDEDLLMRLMGAKPK